MELKPQVTVHIMQKIEKVAIKLIEKGLMRHTIV